MTTAPKLGHAVIYHDPKRSNLAQAAIVSAVNIGGVLDLTVFPAGSSPEFVEGVARSEEQRSGWLPLGSPGF